MMFFTCMIQICSSLSWTNFLSVPYANFSAYMVQISSTLSRNKLSFVPYANFFSCMVQICYSPSWNKLSYVPYTNFSSYMVHISSALIYQPSCPRILRRRKFILFLHCPRNILHKDFFHETEEKDGRQHGNQCSRGDIAPVDVIFSNHGIYGNRQCFLAVGINIQHGCIHIIPAGKEHKNKYRKQP